MNENISPAISVIVSTVDKACIESVLAQSFSDFELLIVGDGATVELNDPRLRFIPTEIFLNANGRRNVGIERARGDYIYFIDDGMIFDNAFEILLKAAKESGAEVIQSTNFVERNGEDVKIIPNRKLLPLNLYQKNFIERAQLKFPESSADAETFCYATECMAPTIAILDDYFYVRDRQKKIRADSADYVKDIDRDEIRCGFMVTSQRKKLWNAQIKLILEFARICRKHDLKWFMGFGTLLGAARHKGFIPWDDDVDLLMPRPDYKKFVQAAKHELKSNYFLDLWYNHAWENEPNEEGLPVVPEDILQKIRERGWWWPIFADFAKIRDNNTAQIQWSERRNVHQGIWIDIMPFDPVPPFDDEQQQLRLGIEKELLLAVGHPNLILQALENDEQLLSPRDELERILSRPFKERALIFESYLEKNYFESEYVSRLPRFFLRDKCYKWRTKAFRDSVNLPFEGVELPAPVDYEQLLTDHYGDWRTLMFNYSHGMAHSVDFSYREYFEKISPGIRVHMF